MVDAAGAIYVIGGYSLTSGTDFQDVWVSTDGGARPDSVGGWVGGVLEGVLEWVLRGYYVVLRGEARVLVGYSRGVSVSSGYLGCT